MNQDQAPNPRLAAIFADTVAAMKEIVRKHRIDQDELHLAGDYFNRLGQSGFCRSLIDVSLAMTSVDVTARVEGGTRPNLEGPFYRADLPLRQDSSLFDHPPPLGSPILTLTGRVVDVSTGRPVEGVVLDVWQADHEGHYDRAGSHLSGRIPVRANGAYRIVTAVPRDYSDHDNDPIGELYRLLGRHNRRAAHIHVKVIKDETCLLTTQLFIPENPYLDSDYVEGAVSDDLILEMAPGAAPGEFEAHFDFAVPTRREPGR